MTLNEAMTTVASEAVKKRKLIYLYKSLDGFFSSDQYWNDWIFKAYPGGRKVLSMIGREMMEEDNE